MADTYTGIFIFTGDGEKNSIFGFSPGRFLQNRFGEFDMKLFLLFRELKKMLGKSKLVKNVFILLYSKNADKRDNNFR